MTFFVLLLLAVLAGGALIAWWGGLFATRRLERRIVVDHLTRRYVAWLPAFHKKKTPLPVVLAFHPGFGAPEGFEEQTGLHVAREAEQFIVVYPEGYKRSWNAGDCCGAAMRENINDRKFVLALLDDLEAVVAIDRRRIYATGFSNGARFCYYLAGTMSDVITAIAPMGGAVLTDERPERPVPIFHVHGLADKWAPYYGGASVWKHAPFHEPVEKGIEFWRDVAGAAVESRDGPFGALADCITYSGGPDGTKIQLCRIPGLGHHWPGARVNDEYQQFIGRFNLGPLGPQISVAGPILRFFAGFALPAAPTMGSRVVKRRVGERRAGERRIGGVAAPDVAAGDVAAGDVAAGDAMMEAAVVRGVGVRGVGVLGAVGQPRPRRSGPGGDPTRGRNGPVAGMRTDTDPRPGR